VTTRACKRCQRRPGIHQTRTTSTRLGDEDIQVVEQTALCTPCRSDADAENLAARSRTSEGWAVP
jgi:hypothetical protein